MAEDHLNELLNVLFRRAQEGLRERGEFYPFAAAMRRDGTIGFVAATMSEAKPQSDDLIALLTQGLREEVVLGHVAVGICYAARVQAAELEDTTDAICVALQDESGRAIDVFLPYKQRTAGKIEYDDLFSTAGRLNVFIQ